MKINLGFSILILLFGCQQQMASEGKIRPFGPAPFFKNQSSAQMPVLGTISRGSLNYSESTRTGQGLKDNPFPITPPFLQRGKERYEINCVPCHDSRGNGNGIIVQRGFLAPPSYHSDRLRATSDAEIYHAITYGYNAMYSYADRVDVPDRWAIVAYIRELQKRGP